MCRATSTPAWARRRTAPCASAGSSTRDSARSTRGRGNGASAADALRRAGAQVDEVSIPALERDNPLDLWMREHVMKMRPAVREVTTGHEDQMFDYSKAMMDLPETPVTDYVDAEEGRDRLRDGFADYFRRYDLLLLPVTTFPAHAHGLTKTTVDGRTVDAFHVSATTVPFNLTGLPALSMRFGTTHDGMPIGVQLVADWHAESAILHLASVLESVSPVRDLHPAI
ncbi:amidase family protein [Asanoa sp. NPDC049518]|uniref:amidase family protein n=1 Tax=unclassified Asanoa TaxID=2685164 RepID=UPI003417A2C9